MMTEKEEEQEEAKWAPVWRCARTATYMYPRCEMHHVEMGSVHSPGNFASQEQCLAACPHLPEELWAAVGTGLRAEDLARKFPLSKSTEEVRQQLATGSAPRRDWELVVYAQFQSEAMHGEPTSSAPEFARLTALYLLDEAECTAAWTKVAAEIDGKSSDRMREIDTPESAAKSPDWQKRALAYLHQLRGHPAQEAVTGIYAVPISVTCAERLAAMIERAHAADFVLGQEPPQVFLGPMADLSDAFAIEEGYDDSEHAHQEDALFWQVHSVTGFVEESTPDKRPRIVVTGLIANVE